ncbi:hypothetical protein RI054_27g113250 [Pseudoscourfieldia marina]
MMMMMTVTSVHDAQAQYAGGSSSGGAEARGVVFQPGGGNRPAAGGGAGSLYSSSYYYGDDDQSNNNNPAADNQRRRRRRQNGNNNNNIGNFNFQQQNNKQQITNTAGSQYTDPRVRPNPAAVITPRPNEPVTAPLVQSSPPAVASGSVVVSAAAATTSSVQDTAALIERLRVWRKLYDEKLRREQLGGGEVEAAFVQKSSSTPTSLVQRLRDVLTRVREIQSRRQQQLPVANTAGG